MATVRSLLLSPVVVRSAAILIALALGACRDEASVREEVVEDLLIFSNDQCLRGAVSDTHRNSLAKRARAGKITRRMVDDYMKDIRAKVRRAVDEGSSMPSFCQVHRKTWRAYFGR